LKEKVESVTAERNAALGLVMKYKTSLREVRGALSCGSNANNTVEDIGK